MYNFPVCISICRAADWLDACRIDPTVVPAPVRVDQSFDRPVKLIVLFTRTQVYFIHLTYHAVVPFWMLGAGIHPNNHGGRRLV